MAAPVRWVAESLRRVHETDAKQQATISSSHFVVTMMAERWSIRQVPAT
jgi:hypothetical protein